MSGCGTGISGRVHAGFPSASVAPVGSVKMLIVPTPGISVTSRTMVAPSDFAFFVRHRWY